MIKIINIAILICSLLLMVAFFKLPYWYYEFMRVVLFLISLWIIFALQKNDELNFLWKEKIRNFTIFFVLIATIYPIFHLWREVWLYVNVVTLIWYWMFLKNINYGNNK